MPPGYFPVNYSQVQNRNPQFSKGERRKWNLTCILIHKPMSVNYNCTRNTHSLRTCSPKLTPNQTQNAQAPQTFDTKIDGKRWIPRCLCNELQLQLNRRRWRKARAWARSKWKSQPSSQHRKLSLHRPQVLECKDSVTRWCLYWYPCLYLSFEMPGIWLLSLSADIPCRGKVDAMCTCRQCCIRTFVVCMNWNIFV